MKIDTSLCYGRVYSSVSEESLSVKTYIHVYAGGGWIDGRAISILFYLPKSSKQDKLKKKKSV